MPGWAGYPITPHSESGHCEQEVGQKGKVVPLLDEWRLSIVIFAALPSPQGRTLFRTAFQTKSIYLKGQMSTDDVLMHNTGMEREMGEVEAAEGGREGEMDSTDKAVSGQQMGETAVGAVECRRRRMTRMGEAACGSEGKVFPELGKYHVVIPTVQ